MGVNFSRGENICNTLEKKEEARYIDILSIK